MQLLVVFVLVLAGMAGFTSRLFAVIRYESIIHEFDPWFNYRSTVYLVQNGFYEFLNWFDERAWYPLGRIVGGTVYPGLMVTSGAIHWVLHSLGIPLHIRDICVFLAPLFSGLTAIATYLLTSELWSDGAGLFAACFMAVIPGYSSRSVAGCYDNEGIALFALQFTYYLWLKSLKSGSIFWSVCTALSYFYMVSAWGGYVFIINLIPLHVFVLLIMGRYSSRLFVSYTIFYIIGLLCSMQIPFVGFQPLKTSEHLAAAGVFVLLMVMGVVKHLNSLNLNNTLMINFLVLLIVCIAVVISLVGVMLISLRVIAPWNGRFYALWDFGYAAKHTPIVTSVAEHRPTIWLNFFMDLHLLMCTFPVGLWYCIRNINDERVFVSLYAVSAVYFAGRMIRLMLTLAPVACILSGIAFSILLDFLFQRNLIPISYVEDKESEDMSIEDRERKDGLTSSTLQTKGLFTKVNFVIIFTIAILLGKFCMHCTWVTSTVYSSPNVVFNAYSTQGGNRSESTIIDDYREAYSWLFQNTPENAKIMSWWDYGYQIAGLANRTTIVDNNTWNNSHIALVGKAMASNESAAYEIMKLLDVDYVLIIFGGAIGYPSDDMNKFMWMIRIAEREYPNEIQTVNYFAKNNRIKIDAEGSKTMRNSLLYKLSYYKFDTPINYDKVRNAVPGNQDFKLTYLEEAFTSVHWIVRIYRVKKQHEFNRPRLTLSQRKIRTSVRLPKKTVKRRKGCLKYKTTIAKGKKMRRL